MKIFPKTFLYMMSLMAAITLIGHGLIYLLISDVYTNQKEDVAEQICAEASERLMQVSPAETEQIVEQYAKQNKAFVSFSNGENQYMFGSVYIEDVLKGEENTYSFQAAPSDQLSGSGELGVESIFNGIDGIMPYLSGQFIKHEVSFENTEGQNCRLQVLLTLQPVNEVKTVVLEILPFTLIISLILSAIAALMYAKKLSTPIQQISDTTERMKMQERDAFCIAKTNDEIGQLAHNVNSLYQELLSSIDHLHEEIDHVSEIEQSKVDFLRAASHELKTPVTAVCTLLDNMILGVGKYIDTETYLPICKEMMLQLSSMIQEILDASKMNGRPDEQDVEISLQEYLANICDTYTMIAKAKGIQLVVDIQNAGNTRIPPNSIQKAISNVLSNAVNYTSNGGHIYVFCENKKMVVKNECVPIPNEDLKHLFEAFYRPDYSRSRNTGGNGLGLYITGKLLDSCQIHYSFEPYEHGMQFSIIFP